MEAIIFLQNLATNLKDGIVLTQLENRAEFGLLEGFVELEYHQVWNSVALKEYFRANLSSDQRPHT